MGWSLFNFFTIVTGGRCIIDSSESGIDKLTITNYNPLVQLFSDSLSAIYDNLIDYNDTETGPTPKGPKDTINIYSGNNNIFKLTGTFSGDIILHPSEGINILYDNLPIFQPLIDTYDYVYWIFVINSSLKLGDYTIHSENLNGSSFQIVWVCNGTFYPDFTPSIPAHGIFLVGDISPNTINFSLKGLLILCNQINTITITTTSPNSIIPGDYGVPPYSTSNPIAVPGTKDVGATIYTENPEKPTVIVKAYVINSNTDEIKQILIDTFIVEPGLNSVGILVPEISNGLYTYSLLTSL
jgi:hypothetical protein